MPRGVYKKTKKHKKNVSKVLMGHKVLKKTRIKMRKARIKSPVRYWLGKKRGAPSTKTRKKQSKALRGKYMGEESSQWRGGKSFEPYTTDWTETLRRSIRERDHYICQLCLEYGNVVHHIDYDKKNCNPENLITLCRRCNTKVNSKRKYWTNYFKNLLEQIFKRPSQSLKTHRVNR